METVIRNVQDLAPSDRATIERLVGQSLGEGEQLIIQVAKRAEAPVENRAHGDAAGTLPPWCNVYEGLSDQQIADLEAAILERANLNRFAD